MINQIVAHTPTWVFALFFGLIYLGMQQSRTRTVTVRRMIILPVAMLALSFSGVSNTFNGSNLSLICWFAAIFLGALATISLISTKQVGYNAETGSFTLPGSWLPLFLMMTLFMAKFAVGVSLAQNPGLAESSSFVVAASTIFGLCSGAFIGRTAKMVGTHGRQLIAQ